MRPHLARLLRPAALLAMAFAVGMPTGTGAPVASRGVGVAQGGSLRHIQALGSVNLAQLAVAPQSGVPQAVRYSIRRELERHSPLEAMLRPSVTFGGASAPVSKVAAGGGGGAGLNGINILEMEKSGTGKYSGSQPGLEPPDQALCVGNGYVMEGVNTAWRVFTTNGTPLTPSVPITQFFKIAPGGQAAPPSSFVSDPRCVYDPQTKRFFALTLEADESSGLTQIPFIRSHTYFAVSKTGDPSGDWNIYSLDITDDGLMGTPLHTSCPCIDDQPLMGLDAFGLYLSANEFSDSEIFPVAPPSQVNTVIGTLPDYRSGQAQVYALSKADLIRGTMPAVQAFDTATFPVPAQDQGKAPISTWSSLQPAASPPGDRSPAPARGAEFFMSQLDFQSAGDNRIAVWALTNTASLGTASPSVQLKNTVITTLNPADTYTAPLYGVDQKDGPHPLGDQCGCPEEQLAANDDRMNQVMLTNGSLWAGLNTALPAASPGGTGKAADPRAGIMYFQVQPGIDAGGNVIATMQRDGYVQVANNSVIFPTIAASPAGPVAMFFTLTGIDYFPSAAWTRLDGIGAGQAPQIHVSGAGAGPEDGFTGYPTSNQAGVPLDPSTGKGVSRWGDYSAAAVDESGCLWGANEYIPDEARDPSGGNWGTYITRIAPAGCVAPAIATKAAGGPVLNINPCGPLFIDPAGDDVFGNGLAPVTATQGQNPQMDILRGDMRLSPDGRTLSTILTINDLSTSLPAGGEGNNYYFYWQFAGTTYYSVALVDATGAVTYADGTQATGGRSQRSGAPADSGSMTLGKNGTVVVNVPVSVIGNPHAGNLLLGANAETREVEGVALVIQYDAAGPGFDYLAGALCAKAAGVAPPPVAGNAPVSAPNTAAAGGRGGLLAAVTLGGLLSLAACGRRRRRSSALR